MWYWFFFKWRFKATVNYFPYYYYQRHFFKFGPSTMWKQNKSNGKKPELWYSALCVGGCPRNPFRIEKPVRKIGPPLICSHFQIFRLCLISVRGGYRGSEFRLRVSKSTFSSLRVLENCLSSLQWRMVTVCLIPVYSLEIDTFPGYRIQWHNFTGYRLRGKHFPVYKTAGFYSFPGYNFGFSSVRDWKIPKYSLRVKV